MPAGVKDAILGRIPSGEAARQRLGDARERAFLRLLRSETNGDMPDDVTYHERVGGHDPMTDKDMQNYTPKIEHFILHGRRTKGIAAGAYQIAEDSWEEASIAVFCLLNVPFFVPSHTNPVLPERVKPYVDCRSFQSNAVTDQIKVAGQFTRAILQVIRIINRSRQIDTHLDLKQHFSQDGKLDGMHDIDGVATKWWCIRAPSGADFVFIDFVCTEEDAKSCSTAMGAPSDNWRQIYHSGGKALFRNPRCSRGRRRINEDARHFRCVQCADRLWIVQADLHAEQSN